MGNVASDIVLQCVASVLSGAVFGNVIAYIADNTELSSMVSGADIPTHVYSMAAYVLTVAAVSLVFGTIPCGLGWYPSYVGLLISIAVLIAIVFFFGSVPTPTERSGERAALLHGAASDANTGEFYDTVGGEGE